MAKYQFELTETFYHTYEIDIPDEVPEDEIEDYFYELSEEAQKEGLVNTESFTWEIASVEKIED